MTGPVQVLVIGFVGASFSGEVTAELTRLREAEVVRLVDVLFLRRAEDGTFHTLPPPSGLDPGAGDVTAEILGGGGEPIHDGQPWSIADLIAPGTAAAIALVEHLWAAPLVEAIASAGGHPLGELWLAPEDRERLLAQP